MCAYAVYMHMKSTVYIPALDGREEAKERNTARWAMYVQDVQYVAIVGKGGERVFFWPLLLS